MGNWASFISITEQLLTDPEFLGFILDEDVESNIDFVREDINSRRHILSNHRASPRTRDRCYAINEMRSLTDQQFTRMFRLNRTAFYLLLDKIKPHIEARPSLKHIFHHRADEISAETKLAVTLRWLMLMH